jgi:5-methylcytosine-specific restriction endonuclease McrA
MKTPKLNKDQRREILNRDNFLCQHCGVGGRESDYILEIHHKIPRSCGGSNDPSNLETLCVVCHDLWHHNKYSGRPRTFTELKDNQGKRW